MFIVVVSFMLKFIISLGMSLILVVKHFEIITFSKINKTDPFYDPFFTQTH